MKILVIDAQGGGIGKSAVVALKNAFNDAQIIAVGTNTVATTSMLKAGADHGATGENAVIVCSKDVDFIVGPVGIVIADSMYGEITPKMAVAIGQSTADKILIPMNHCKNQIVGVNTFQVDELINCAIKEIETRIKTQ